MSSRDTPNAGAATGANTGIACTAIELMIWMASIDTTAHGKAREAVGVGVGGAVIAAR
jgi:hypothetical protein